MEFQVLSHAGLAVRARGVELVVDPWLVGSCYWRSWWNYPPSPRDVIDGLKPDAIYLTHVHWDHFQGPSLKRFDPATPVYVPKGHYARMKRDLADCGFHDVRELRHGETVSLAPGFTLTSWQFFPMLDSAVVVEADGVTLFDANDAKFMGAPLRQILQRHGRPDVVFRSHSSANGRLCYEVVDAPEAEVDDPTVYADTFVAFAKATGARYAVPFASNHCFLHPDVFDLNHTVTTPLKLMERVRRETDPSMPEVVVMTPGDAWSSVDGFTLDPDRMDWFTDREARLTAYRERVRPKLEAFVAKEARSTVRLGLVQRWAKRMAEIVPRPVRLAFRGLPLWLVLRSGEREAVFRVDLWAGEAEAREAVDPREPTFELHTTALVFKQCVALKLFSHLQISKRVRFRVERSTWSRMKLLNLIWELDDYDYLPLSEVDWPRMAETWSLRWREVALFSRIFGEMAAGRPFDQVRWLSSPEV